MLVALATLAVPHSAKAAQEVDVYFGGGNFHHLQHELVLKEALDLGRRAGDVTSVAGYAGGEKVGELDRICYSGFAGSPDYARLGHGQVVRVTLPKDKVADFARLYFGEFSKRKPFDKGAQYRASVGVRGGMKSPILPLIEEASEGKVKLVKGVGDEADNLGQDVVYVYDTKRFPFRPAELSNQFQDDLPDKFTSDYRALNDVLRKIGVIFTTGCPEVRL